MRVLVCGGRYFSDRPYLFSALNSQHAYQPITLLIEGGAPGADSLARQWAEAASIRVAEYPADWRQYGKAAGPIRNQQMLNEGQPEKVIAFFDRPVEESRGTADMVRRAKQAGIPVVTYLWRSGV